MARADDWGGLGRSGQGLKRAVAEALTDMNLGNVVFNYFSLALSFPSSSFANFPCEAEKRKAEAEGGLPRSFVRWRICLPSCELSWQIVIAEVPFRTSTY